eukprot:CAMPEP_0172305654 /NCGR_PEP_ID=MMETSP1058-20130122/6909_1 /TAXON_ID=83371 /ORGANISM="Detonula confervacea, Strain CCMP 353" /LENGTH=105 /DNA_ID=CAMNT_0013017323 /DNA_START=25 /DNA_END=338 /DNA_ORIENTATION=+
MAAIQTQTSYGKMRTVTTKIATAIDINNASAHTEFEREFKKKVVVLILDEIDMPFKHHKGIGETWFRTLIHWAEDKEMCFSMIGISNCINDANATRIRELGNSPR